MTAEVNGSTSGNHRHVAPYLGSVGNSVFG
jgi:hypothetical protein